MACLFTIVAVVLTMRSLGWCPSLAGSQMEEWLALGLDPGTELVSEQMPPDATIVGWAKAMLGLA